MSPFSAFFRATAAISCATVGSLFFPSALISSMLLPDRYFTEPRIECFGQPLFVALRGSGPPGCPNRVLAPSLAISFLPLLVIHLPERRQPFSIINVLKLLLTQLYPRSALLRLLLGQDAEFVLALRAMHDACVVFVRHIGACFVFRPGLLAQPKPFLGHAEVGELLDGEIGAQQLEVPLAER